MSEEVERWVVKAEGDYFSAMREYRARKHPNYDSACFHAQQCIEKYLKALLISKQVPFPRTHDLLPLLNLCRPFHPFGGTWTDDVEWLTQYAVLFRYPGETASKEDAQQAVSIMKKLTPSLREFLNYKS